MSVKICFKLPGEDDQMVEMARESASWDGKTLVVISWKVVVGALLLIIAAVAFVVYKPEKQVVAPAYRATNTPIATFAPAATNTPTNTLIAALTPTATMVPTNTAIPTRSFPSPEWTGYCWGRYELEEPANSMDQNDWQNWTCATLEGQNYGVLPYRGDSWIQAQQYGVYLNGQFLPEGNTVDIERCPWDPEGWCVWLK